jgi:squalene synthase HpnC
MPTQNAINHYENFPVASLLCPPHLRAPITAIYHFARTADDMADEGDAPPAQRLGELALYRADLRRALSGQGHSGQWPQVFKTLPKMVTQFKLPVPLLEDLLSAFEQDVRFSAEGRHYATEAELLDYCKRSANPVGRLLLHLYGVNDAIALAHSDNICTALQLINFWQDLSLDIPRGRYYLPSDACATHGVDLQSVLARTITPETTKLIAKLTTYAGAMMLKGSPLVFKIPGRAGWELRLVVQGGLRILDKIQALNYATLQTRPTLRWYDYGVMLWRALWMR